MAYSCADVTAVIVSYNHLKDLKNLLDRLLQSSEYKPLSILVVDNRSTDGSWQWLQKQAEQYSQLNIVQCDQNRGGAGGFRRGVNEAMGSPRPLIWLLDDDALPTESALNHLLTAADSLENWGALGSTIAQMENPLYVTESGGDLYWWRGKLRTYFQNQPVESLNSEPRRVGHSAAASLLTRKEVVEHCGFFEDIFIHFDDVEWCYRINRAGLPVYTVPPSVVYHPFKRGNTPAWIRYYDARNILLVYKRNRPMLIAIPWLRFRLMALVFTLRGETETARMIIRGQRDFRKKRMLLRSEL